MDNATPSASPATVASPEPAPAESTPATPPAVRAQMLATEHWSLLATRSMTWSEVHGRITIHLTVTSAALVVVALTVQADGFGTAFQIVAVGLSAAVTLLGTLTAIRVLNASDDDFVMVMGMNRLRAAYVELDPQLAQFLVTGYHDDQAGVLGTYTMGQQRGASQVLGSTMLFLLAVNTMVAGVLVALVAMVAEAQAWSIAVSGTIGGVVYFLAFALFQYRRYTRWMVQYEARFPSAAE